jgi:segregation and condensation protein B
MEFDPSATVETVIIDGEEQAIEVEALEVTEITVEETVIEETEELTEEVTPESEDKPDETK